MEARTADRASNCLASLPRAQREAPQDRACVDQQAFHRACGADAAPHHRRRSAFAVACPGSRRARGRSSRCKGHAPAEARRARVGVRGRCEPADLRVEDRGRVRGRFPSCGGGVASPHVDRGRETSGPSWFGGRREGRDRQAERDERNTGGASEGGGSSRDCAVNPGVSSGPFIRGGILLGPCARAEEAAERRTTRGASETILNPTARATPLKYPQRTPDVPRRAAACRNGSALPA